MIYETIFLHKNEQLQKDKYIALKPAIIHCSSDTSNFCKENFGIYIAFNWSIYGDPIIFNTNIISSKQNHTHIEQTTPTLNRPHPFPGRTTSKSVATALSTTVDNLSSPTVLSDPLQDIPDQRDVSDTVLLNSSPPPISPNHSSLAVVHSSPLLLPH